VLGSPSVRTIKVNRPDVRCSLTAFRVSEPEHNSRARTGADVLPTSRAVPPCWTRARARLVIGLAFYRLSRLPMQPAPRRVPVCNCTFQVRNCRGLDLPRLGSAWPNESLDIPPAFFLPVLLTIPNINYRPIYYHPG
jgi:hypothetical protein